MCLLSLRRTRNTLYLNSSPLGREKPCDSQHLGWRFSYLISGSLPCDFLTSGGSYSCLLGFLELCRRSVVSFPRSWEVQPVFLPNLSHHSSLYPSMLLTARLPGPGLVHDWFFEVFPPSSQNALTTQCLWLQCLFEQHCLSVLS